ncbi:hypothetical protein E0E62_23580 [Streptomyces sp. 16-176A]
MPWTGPSVAVPGGSAPWTPGRPERPRPQAPDGLGMRASPCRTPGGTARRDADGGLRRARATDDGRRAAGAGSERQAAGTRDGRGRRARRAAGTGAGRRRRTQARGGQQGRWDPGRHRRAHRQAPDRMA